MKDGFIKAGTASPILRVADCENNANVIIDEYLIAKQRGVKLLVFPELSVTSASAGELFRNRTLLASA